MFLGVALSGMFEVVTSAGVLDELLRHLSVAEKTGLTADQAQRRVDELAKVLTDCTADAVAPVHARSDYAVVGLPDLDDEHVLAGALAADADLLLTANLADFPGELLAAHGLDVLPPDELCADGLRRMLPAWVNAVRFALQFPPKGVGTAKELGMALHGCGMEASGGILLSASWQGI